MGLSLKQVSMEEFDWSKTELPKLTKSKQQSQSQIQPNVEQLKCPRCDSSNTKFCYFNNYNKSQPRHFCRACKRHWTNGGTLRNVPVGGCRKTKRLKKSTPKSTKSSTAATSAAVAASTSDGLQNLPLFQTLFPIPSEFENLTINYGVLNSQNMDFSAISSTTSTQSLISQKLCNQLDEELIHVETEKTEQTEQPSFYHPWQYPETGCGGADMSESYWSWEEIETFAATDLNITWEDDNDIKP